MSSDLLHRPQRTGVHSSCHASETARGPQENLEPLPTHSALSRASGPRRPPGAKTDRLRARRPE
eukprot:2278282-Lingulodinium_polyedra.AAC.1